MAGQSQETYIVSIRPQARTFKERIHQAVANYYGREAHLPSDLRPLWYSFPRNNGRRGRATEEEALQIDAVLMHLVQQIPPERRPIRIEGQADLRHHHMPQLRIAPSIPARLIERAQIHFDGTRVERQYEGRYGKVKTGEVGREYGRRIKRLIKKQDLRLVEDNLPLSVADKLIEDSIVKAVDDLHQENVTNPDRARIEQGLKDNMPTASKTLGKRFTEYVTDIDGPGKLLQLLNVFPFFGHLKSAARSVAMEDIRYQAATGRNPKVGIFRAIGWGAAELLMDIGLAKTQHWENLFQLGPITIPSAVAHEATHVVADHFIAMWITRSRYHNSGFPEDLSHPAVDHALEIASLFPGFLLAPSLKFMQAYGRRILRREMVKPFEELKPDVQQLIVDAARLKTVRAY